ncbi:hypothetical protein L6164_036184 [Bauhinia variegata]|uniref:Uncharacterized protein n=1 Tax=Bauhinia variegata TaxID=167791 RepID=A0ACB9KG80_BAUVA|nr:hypothetical protein L6164_036184 [Bauhinia variegata]
MNPKKAMTIPLVRGKILGKGSCSTVFRAVSATPQRGYGDITVAVKSTAIPSCALSLLKEENILKHFRRCPEIVQCYGSDITVEDGVSVQNLFLEYAPYGTLADLIKTGGYLESQVRVFTRMLLRGLSRIHRMDFVHCDLKPDNVLVFPGTETASCYQLKIADFGSAKTLEEKRNFNAGYWRGRFRGTPSYMSPESVAVGKIGPALDIWSLGCIVIEMITGLPPWTLCGSGLQIKTEKDLKYRLVFDEKAGPKIPEGVSKDCRDFLGKCLDRDSNWRWTADMLLLHPFLAPPRGSKAFNQYMFSVLQCN